MDTNDKLTPGNIKLVGVTLTLHARLKALSKMHHAPMHEVIAGALDKAALYEEAQPLFAAPRPTGDDHANT